MLQAESTLLLHRVSAIDSENGAYYALQVATRLQAATKSIS